MEATAPPAYLGGVQALLLRLLLPAGGLVLAAAAAPARALRQEAAPAPGPQSAALERAGEPARAAWQHLLASARRASGTPIESFRLSADVRARGGVHSNDFRVEYRFLAPSYIRFALPNDKGTAKRETGRGPGEGQRAYWLREGDDVHALEGRGSTEDRRLVDEMLVVARNFLAFSDLTRLALTTLEALDAAPPDLPASWKRKPWWRKLVWLRVESPDFALLHPDRRLEAPGPQSYAAELGLDPEDGLPRVAVVRGVPGPEGWKPPSPLCFRLDRYQLHDGALVPFAIQVHALVETPEGPRFAEDPAQDIALLEVSLRPGLQPADFLP